jgi:Gluconate 2-dehydrogenase subunit 3
MATRFSRGRRRVLQSAALLPAALKHAAADAGKFPSVAELELIGELAETIIPADSHSGGAKAAGVAAFIAQSLPDAAERDFWRQGLRLADRLSAKQNGKRFVKAGVAERVKVVEALSAEGRFFQELKRLTVLGYYTSRIGILDELEYKGNQIHKDFSGCEVD